MWLLSTDRAELKYFNSPEDVPEGYAILSHVWGDDEKNFQFMQALQKETRDDNSSPRDRAGPKIRCCCILAESYGYRWVWIDTCCIDKTSSAELSEAINSMFRYYSLADICYAYLEDVTGPGDGSYERSKWHTRGWTLQELIAPRYLVFLTGSWGELGTKHDFAVRLQKITNIPAPVLTFDADFRNTSVAQRMSWAAARRTTREEDRAYSLFGLFGVNLPIVYGEGSQSFQRLQEEILRHYTDTSLFVWSVPDRPILLEQIMTGAISLQQDGHDHSPESFLLARSPKPFANCNNVMYIPHNQKSPLVVSSFASHLTSVHHSFCLQNDIAYDFPRFNITPYGILCYLPIITTAIGYAVAMLNVCRTDFGNEHAQVLALLLLPCPFQRVNASRPIYCICPILRMVEVTNEYSPSVQWKEIYLSHRPPPGTDLQAIGITSRIPLSAPFRFLQLDKFLKENDLFRIANVSKLAPGWTGYPPMLIVLDQACTWMPSTTRRVIVNLGRCTMSTPLNVPGPLWAHITFPSSNALDMNPYHNCSEHHIPSWPLGTKVFESPDQGSDNIRLAFTASMANTLVVQLFPHTVMTGNVPSGASMNDYRVDLCWNEIYREMSFFRSQLAAEMQHRSRQSQPGDPYTLLPADQLTEGLTDAMGNVRNFYNMQKSVLTMYMVC
jgi:hypothetical protein